MEKRKYLRSAFASRNCARALAACLPRQDQVYITTDGFSFAPEFDEMPCELESTENQRSFENTQPHLKRNVFAFR